MAATALLASVGIAIVGTQAAAATGKPGAIAVSPDAGPVGTVVQVTGQVASGCRPSSGVADVTIERSGQTTTGGVDELTTAVAPDGSFHLEYRVPADIGGSANRGLYAYPVAAGTYDFRFTTSAPCSISSPAQFEVTGPASPSPASYVGIASTPDGEGYWLAQAGGGVDSKGDATFYGSLPGIGVHPAKPIVAVAPTPDGRGYWLVGADGGVFAFGDARYYGSLPSQGISPAGPIVAIAPTTDGDGYRLLGADGGVFSFGNAVYGGRQTGSDSPFESIAALASGAYDVASSHPGRIWREPGGVLLANPDLALAASITAAAVTPDGRGAWQVGLDGGVFAFGDAKFYGSLPRIGVHPAKPIVDIATTPDEGGYWLLGSDGGVFAFGDAGFYGSAA